MESIFECGVCFKTYNHSEKKPLSLPCGHTFCLECLKQINKHSIIKCPFDKIAHHTIAENLPVNYAVLTALPMTSQSPGSGDSGQKQPNQAMCDIHKNKKIKFFCKSDQEMFCSKCVLRHTNAKHDVQPCSYKILDMKRLVKEMLEEVEQVDRNNNVCEELYGKLEQKVKKKFHEEVDRLEKSFRRIIEQLEIQQQNLYTMMKEQIDKELKCLTEKKKKVKERDEAIVQNRQDLTVALNNMEYYSDDMTFNTYFEKKKRDLKVLSVLNDFIKPNPYFVYYMFKDSIHVDDYGSIKETLFKFPQMTRNSANQANIYLFGDDVNSKVSLCYDVNEDEWTMKKLPDTSQQKFYQCSAAIALSPIEILITGGGSPPKKDSRLYLTQKNDIVPKAMMNESRNAHAITLCKGAVFVLGGFSGKQRLNSVERYSVKEDKWTPMAPMKDKRHYLSACAVNDEFIYAFGGFFGSTEQEINDSIEVYEVEKNIWSVLTVRMKNALWACSALSISPSEIILIGGKNTNRNGEVNLFNVQTKQWKQLHNMNQLRVSHKSFYMQGKIYVIGGDYEMSCEVYDLKENKWSFISSYNSLLGNSLYSFSSAMAVLE